MTSIAQTIRKSLALSMVDSRELAKMLFYAAYTIWLVASLVSATFVALPFSYKAIRALCLVLLAISELCKQRYRSEDMLSLALAGIVIAANLPAGLGAYADLALFAAVSRSYSFRTVAKVSAVVTSVVLAGAILFSDMGLIPTYVERGLRVREYLGFRYSLYPMQLLLTATCLVAYLRGSKFSVMEALILLIASYFVFCRTNSRSSFYLAVITIVVVFVIAFAMRRKEASGRTKDSPLRLKGVGVLAAAIFPVFALVSICVTIAYDPNVAWMSQLNASGILSGRLSLGQAAIYEYGIPILGQSISLVGNGLDSQGFQDLGAAYNYVDCAYVSLLVGHGIIVSAVFLVCASYACWRAWEAHNYILLFVLLIIAVHCVIDDLSLKLYYNAFLLLAGQTFSSMSPDAYRA